jgi:hypothetical protein
MKRVFQMVPFLFLALLALPASRGDDKKPQEIRGWGTVVDPAGDCKVVEKDGKVTITVPGSPHNLNPTPRYNNVLAPRVLRDVDGDFSVQVKVNAFSRPQAGTSSTKVGNSFVAAGLLVWQDDKNFVRFFRSANGEGDNLFGHLEVYRGGKFVGDGFGNMDEDKATYLKVTRKGNKFSFALSEDGKGWTTIQGRNADLGEIDLPKKLKAGVAATNSTKKEFTPVFEGLSVMAK